MTDIKINGKELEQAVDHLESICIYAYENGYHELGYNPIKTLLARIAELKAESVEARVGELKEELAKAKRLHKNGIERRVRFSTRAATAEAQLERVREIVGRFEETNTAQCERYFEVDSEDVDELCRVLAATEGVEGAPKRLECSDCPLNNVGDCADCKADLPATEGDNE